MLGYVEGELRVDAQSSESRIKVALCFCTVLILFSPVLGYSVHFMCTRSCTVCFLKENVCSLCHWLWGSAWGVSLWTAEGFLAPAFALHHLPVVVWHPQERGAGCHQTVPLCHLILPWLFQDYLTNLQAEVVGVPRKR